MSIRVRRFAGEFEELAAWTGEAVEDLRAQEAHHDGPRDVWLAWEGDRVKGDRVIGVMRPWVRPDGRCTLYFGRSAPRAYERLVGVIDGECFTSLDAADTSTMTIFEGLGFAEGRREREYAIPVSSFDAPLPAGLNAITADRTELEPLMLLDCALREDVPGADGWQPDPHWFREETYDSPYFDPLTYVVALDGDDYVGLARIWNGPRPVPRLGMVGVLAGYRRRGLGRALIARAFAPLVERGVPGVVAEADATNVASNALLTELHGVVTGETVELRRRP
jgi:RimJ/RimL family protein N-acetyltransferase